MSASVFPAPAGMSRAATYGRIERLSFPRTCGDEPKDAGGVGADLLFSPHLRG